MPGPHLGLRLGLAIRQPCYHPDEVIDKERAGALLIAAAHDRSWHLAHDRSWHLG